MDLPLSKRTATTFPITQLSLNKQHLQLPLAPPNLPFEAQWIGGSGIGEKGYDMDGKTGNGKPSMTVKTESRWNYGDK